MKKKYKLHQVERIYHDLIRYAVVGGWLYESYSEGNSNPARALQFIPDPNVEIEQ